MATEHTELAPIRQIQDLMRTGRDLQQWRAGETTLPREVEEFYTELSGTLETQVRERAQDPTLQGLLALTGEASLTGIDALNRLKDAAPGALEVGQDKFDDLMAMYSSRLENIRAFFERHGALTSEAEAFMRKVAAGGHAVMVLEASRLDEDEVPEPEPAAAASPAPAPAAAEAIRLRKTLVLDEQGIVDPLSSEVIIRYAYSAKKSGRELDMTIYRRLIVEHIAETENKQTSPEEITSLLMDNGLSLDDARAVMHNFSVWRKASLHVDRVELIVSNGSRGTNCRYMLNPDRTVDLIKATFAEPSDQGAAEAPATAATPPAPATPPAEAPAAEPEVEVDLRPKHPTYLEVYGHWGPDNTDLARTTFHLHTLLRELEALGFETINEQVAEGLEQFIPHGSRQNADQLRAARADAQQKIATMVQDPECLDKFEANKRKTPEVVAMVDYFRRQLEINADLFVQLLTCSVELHEVGHGLPRVRVLVDSKTRQVIDIESLKPKV